MGFYIETNSNKNKADYLIKNAKAVRVRSLPPLFDATGKTVLVCVVDNGPFEAAGVAFSVDEMNAFLAPDHGYVNRPRTWLIVPRAEVIRHCPFVEEMLPTLENSVSQ